MESRSIWRRIALLTLLLFVAPSARAQVLLSNFPGTTAATGVNNKAAARVDKNFWLASGITIGGATDFRFTSLQVSLTNSDNVPYSLLGGIYSSVGGNPGIQLSDFSAVAVPGATDPASTFTFETNNPFTLGAGNSYWFVLRGEIDSPATGWNVSSPGTAPTGISDVTWAGQRYSLDAGATWANDVEFQPYRMQVNGAPITTVPEPSTMALLGAGLVGLVLSRQRRRC